MRAPPCTFCRYGLHPGRCRHERWAPSACLYIDAVLMTGTSSATQVATAAYVADAGVRSQCPANNPRPALAGRDCLDLGNTGCFSRAYWPRRSRR